MSKNIREQLFLTVYEVAEIMNMGKSKCYDYINSPDCPFSVVKIGRLKEYHQTASLNGMTACQKRVIVKCR